MDKQAIVTQLKEIIKPFLEHEDDSVFEGINEQTNLVDELSFDSVDLIEIVIEIEEAFEIKIEDSEISTIKTLADMIGLIQTKQANV